MDRRSFLVAGSLAAAAPALRWLRSGGLVGAAGTPHAAVVADASSAVSADSVFAAVVRAVLPSEDPRFAQIQPSAVARRATTIFSLDKDATIQQNLILFDDLTQFPQPPPSIAVAEAALFPPDDPRKNASTTVAARIAKDANAYQALRTKEATQPVLFGDLGLAEQRAYLALWARSALGVRRRFYQSMKTLVMAATYSMDETWPIIGYAGPLLHLHPQ